MLKASQVEHAHTAISTTADEDIDTVGTESNVINLLVMSNQLCLGGQCWDVPDGASRVNAGSDNQTGRDGVPVKRCDGGSVFGGLGI